MNIALQGAILALWLPFLGTFSPWARVTDGIIS
jgi:hypothetical protein